MPSGAHAGDTEAVEGIGVSEDTRAERRRRELVAVAVERGCTRRLDTAENGALVDRTGFALGHRSAVIRVVAVVGDVGEGVGRGGRDHAEHVQSEHDCGAPRGDDLHDDCPPGLLMKYHIQLCLLKQDCFLRSINVITDEGFTAGLLP